MKVRIKHDLVAQKLLVIFPPALVSVEPKCRSLSVGELQGAKATSSLNAAH